MKKPTVDYRKFRLSRINEPQFSHLKLLLSWLVYFAFYFLTENLIPPEKCHVMYCPLDDRIPFCEYFLIPYVVWYLLVAGSLLYFLLYHVESFKKLQTYIIITQVIAMAVYILYPNMQNLRPEVFPRDNFLTQCIKLLYLADTNTGVCPSLHVAYSIGIASVWLKERDVARGWKVLIVMLCGLICVSTHFIKQHSVVDGFAAILVCCVAEWITFKKIKWNAG